MNQLIFNNCAIDVIRKDIKNVHLAVYPPEGRVRLAVPLAVDDESIRLFALSKLAWIKKKQRQFEKQERQSPRILVQRESHYFKGTRYLLRVIEHVAPPKIELKTKKYLDMYVRPSTTIEQRQKILNDWYRKHLKNDIPELIRKWESILSVSVKDWSVKSMKTKWGACNIEARRIWVNLELAKKPSQCLEYILVHEMVHLLERQHNDRFKSLMDKYMPQWKFYRSQLNSLPIKHEAWDY